MTPGSRVQAKREEKKWHKEMRLATSYLIGKKNLFPCPHEKIGPSQKIQACTIIVREGGRSRRWKMSGGGEGQFVVRQGGVGTL